MRLVKLQLQNFQLHKNLVIEFTNGVNAIHGASGTGKSCLIRSLRWLLYNDIKGDCIRRTGTKKTSVKGWFSNGMTLEKIKSASINAYILEKDGESKRFDAAGKTVPEEIVNALQMYPIEVNKEKIILNIQDQLSQHFLLVGAGLGSFRAKLLNKLTGNELIDKVYQSYNKDLLNLNKVERIYKKDLEEKQEEFIELKQLKTDKTDKLSKISVILNDLEVKSNSITTIKAKTGQIQGVLLEIETLQKRLTEVKLPENFEDLKEKAELYQKVKQLYITTASCVQILKNTKEKLDSIKLPNTIDELNTLYGNYEKLEDIAGRQEENEIDLEELQRKYDKIKSLPDELEKQYNELLKKCKVCPTCKQETKEDVKL